jgi:putative hydrolase of the HAD superfamily
MKLPLTYDNYIFDLYGTLVDIHTDESDTAIWEKLAMFYGYYGALYETKELKERYETLVKSSEAELKKKIEKSDADAQFAISYAHEASPEIHIEDVFEKLYEEKGVNPTKELSVHTGQFFRVMSTEYIKLYPGTKEMLKELKKAGKNVYLLSNAQRIFTAYEMRRLDIFDLFDDVFISSDYNTKKPDIRFYKEPIEMLPEATQLK